LDVNLVTIYTSLSSGANLLLLMFWEVGESLGNRPLLIAVGLVVASLALLLWLGTGELLVCGVGVWFAALHAAGRNDFGAIALCNNIQMETSADQATFELFCDQPQRFQN
jgi:hypothetical protein